MSSRSSGAYAGHVLAGLGLGSFAVASLWCGLSTSFGMLIVGRTVQGLGAAMALVGAVPVLSAIRGSDEHAIRLWGLAGTIGVAVGPALGGFLTQLFSWRSIFLLQAPLAALALVAVFDAACAHDRAAAAHRGTNPHGNRQHRFPRAVRRVGRRALPVGTPPRRRVGMVADRGRDRRHDLAGRDDRGAQADTRPAAADRGRGRRHRARGRSGGARVPSRVHCPVGGRGVGRVRYRIGTARWRARAGGGAGERAGHARRDRQHRGAARGIRARPGDHRSRAFHQSEHCRSRCDARDDCRGARLVGVAAHEGFVGVRPAGSDRQRAAGRSARSDRAVQQTRRGDRREATGNPRRCCRRDPRHVDPRVPFVVPDRGAVRDRRRVRGRIVTHDANRPPAQRVT